MNLIVDLSISRTKLHVFAATVPGFLDDTTTLYTYF